MSYYDEEAGLLGGGFKQDYTFEFAERQVRQGFIRKTFVVVLGCAAFATQSRYDLTLSSGALVSAGLALLSACVLNLFLRAPWLYVAICGLGVLLFSLYLVFDIQLLMGGHKYALSPDEYVFASLNLYLDIINIFLYLLQLLGERRD
ncbi:Protein lifeguard 1 [Tetrabaena socialis]|uniref:Protein lifeguard 1 n=1 Tax=Tetrabaena socialis TaxID=47790 RepID=A0A2J8ACP6_9CHLO|nr:Protein lifeguard 1 [Tetrabaena socialis]|eukprot:PNH10289.1 Protein lifeguard 1 [Tetrabaena socialis]